MLALQSKTHANNAKLEPTCILRQELIGLEMNSVVVNLRDSSQTHICSYVYVHKISGSFAQNAYYYD